MIVYAVETAVWIVGAYMTGTGLHRVVRVLHRRHVRGRP